MISYKKLFSYVFFSLILVWTITPKPSGGKITQQKAYQEICDRFLEKIDKYQLLLSQQEQQKGLRTMAVLTAIYDSQNKLNKHRKKVIATQAAHYFRFYTIPSSGDKELSAQLAKRIIIFCICLHRLQAQLPISYQLLRKYKKVIKKLLFKYGFMKRPDQQVITEKELKKLIIRIMKITGPLRFSEKRTRLLLEKNRS